MLDIPELHINVVDILRTFPTYYLQGAQSIFISPLFILTSTPPPPRALPARSALDVVNEWLHCELRG